MLSKLDVSTTRCHYYQMQMKKKLCLLKSFNILFNYFPDELAWSKLEFTDNVMLDRGWRYECILKLPHLE